MNEFQLLWWIELNHLELFEAVILINTVITLLTSAREIMWQLSFALYLIGEKNNSKSCAFIEDFELWSHKDQRSRSIDHEAT